MWERRAREAEMRLMRLTHELKVLANEFDEKAETAKFDNKRKFLYRHYAHFFRENLSRILKLVGKIEWVDVD